MKLLTITFVMCGIAFLISGLYYFNEVKTNNGKVNYVDCYDNNNNKIIGEVCQEDITNQTNKHNLGGGFIGLILGVIFLISSLWVYNIERHLELI